MIDLDVAIMASFEAYFSTANASFERAFAKAGQAVVLKIGDQRWLVRQAGDGADRYLRALAHLQLSDSSASAADLTVSLWDYESSGEALPMPSWTWARRLPHSQETSFDHDRYIAVENFNGFYFLLDRSARQALVWHPHWSDLPSYEFASPLRDLIELWFKPSNLIRLHAGAVGTKSGGVLLVGKSGSGKSTTSLACLFSGLGYAGDDYVLVDSQRLILYSIYNSGKLVPDNVFRLPQLKPYIENSRALDEEKTIFYLGAAFPDQMLTQFPLRAVFVPHLTNQPESRLVPISPVAAIQALAPSTLLQEADPTPREFQKIARIAKGLPCYRLDTGTDLDQLTRLIKDFLYDA